MGGKWQYELIVYTSSLSGLVFHANLSTDRGLQDVKLIYIGNFGIKIIVDILIFESKIKIPFTRPRAGLLYSDDPDVLWSLAHRLFDTVILSTDGRKHRPCIVYNKLA